MGIPKTRQKQKGRRKEIPQAIANSVSRNIGCLNVAILWNAKTNTFAKRINQVNEPKLDQCLQISLRGVGMRKILKKTESFVVKDIDTRLPVCRRH